MKAIILQLAIIAISAIPAFSKVIVLEPRNKYAHKAEVIQIAARSPQAGLGVLARKRSFDYTPLVVRADGVTEIGSFDLGVKFPSEPLFNL